MSTVKYHEVELNKLPKKELIRLFLLQQADMNNKFDLLLEQLQVMKQGKFGSSSEKSTIEGQMTLEDMTGCFNEAEHTADGNIAEPLLEQIIPEHRRKIKPKGKRDADLSIFPTRTEEHTLSEEKLCELFDGSYRRLPDDVYKKLEFYPATFEVVEHRIAVYCGNKNQQIIRADRPAEIMKNSVVTPSLLAGILNYKYVNSQPINRLAEEFKRNDAVISKQTMCNWVIRGTERYLSLLYERMHQKLGSCMIVHADESPLRVTRDGRDTKSKSYMWVYKSGTEADQPQMTLFDYQKTRHADHPKKFLQDFKGILISDGYRPYQMIGEERPDEITVAGCWSHARRHFVNATKALGKTKAKGTLAEAALSHISAIYHKDNSLSKLNLKERLKQRQLYVKPLVEAYFTWIKSVKDEVQTKSETGKGFTYCINQERYLKVFLNHPELPLDNNAAERAHRTFCVGKKNWYVTSTVEGAQASAIAYSIAETAKANHLKPYEYYKYLLEEIPKHVDKGSKLDFLDDLLPWSSNLPEKVKKTIK